MGNVPLATSLVRMIIKLAYDAAFGKDVNIEDILITKETLGQSSMLN